MNRPIVRIYALVLLLLATLVYFTSKWAVFDAEELEANRDNRRPLIEEQIPRGSITTADGVLVAESLPEGGGRNPVYVRRYPEGSLFGNPVGYSYVEVERTGIELENDLLIGEENEFATIIDQLRDQQPEGANITLTLDSEAQRIATEGLQSAISVLRIVGRHWWRSSPPRARCARWPRSRVSTRTRSRTPRTSRP